MFKYSAGQIVEYSPVRTRPGTYVVVRQMPLEDPDSPKYRIKSSLENFERVVPEHSLSRSGH